MLHSPPRTQGLHFVLKSNIGPLPGLVALGCRKTSCLLGSRASRVQGERGFGSGLVRGGGGVERAGGLPCVCWAISLLLLLCSCIKCKALEAEHPPRLVCEAAMFVGLMWI